MNSQPQVYLHHYPASLFSEKIRVLLGHLGVEWNSVVTPSIMPRPLLMPLTGGYRKTPTLQIGANVYCDTAVIARGLVRLTGNMTLFAPGFVAHRVAEWADTQLFRVTVALNFRPQAIGSMLVQLAPGEIEAFGKDRAELSKGSSMQTIPESSAIAYVGEYLSQLDGSLEQAFLLGDAPSIADFSVYHCLWFLKSNAHNAPMLDDFASVRAWMDRMAAFGHGKFIESSGEDALAHARECEPQTPGLVSALPEGISLGDRVTVTPIDYGLIPVAGRLEACGVGEIVLAREDGQAGRVMTHFPSAGFELSKA